MGLKRVLLTGAAGRIGSAFFAAVRERYRFRLADLNAERLQAASTAEVLRLDVSHLDECRAACAGIDSVIHLAADPSPEADFHESLLANNVMGTFNIFQAAAEAGCQRLVFASSLHAIAGHPLGSVITEESPVRPINMYGAGKCFGEAAAAAFSAQHGLSTIAIRIGAYDPPWITDDPSPLNLSAYISVRDMNQLLVRCIETPDIPFAIIHGISNNRIKRVEITRTQHLLGYQPQDDAFALFARGD
jgi:nucleoside-diphosphate-sugar epimerase